LGTSVVEDFFEECESGAVLAQGQA
jgi:hypothetical protein